MSPTGPPQFDMDNSVYAQAEQATDRVETRLRAELGKAEPDTLMKHFGSLVFFAAQKLIDRKVKTGEERPTDDAVIASCSRLFNECFAANSLAQRGLELQAVVLLRSAFEIASQAMLLMQDDDLARKWVQEGRRLQPSDVRKKLSMSQERRDQYARLSRLSHPNMVATQMHAITVIETNQTALAYGGWFLPRTAGMVIVDLLDIQLSFLEAFYSHYEHDLAKHDLLWRRATVDGGEAIPWDKYLAVFREVWSHVAKQLESLPADADFMAQYFVEQQSSSRQDVRGG